MLKANAGVSGTLLDKKRSVKKRSLIKSYLSSSWNEGEE